MTVINNIKNFPSFFNKTIESLVNFEHGKVALATLAMGLISAAAISLPPLGLAVGTAVVVTSGLVAMGLWAAFQLISQPLE